MSLSLMPSAQLILRKWEIAGAFRGSRRCCQFCTIPTYNNGNFLRFDLMVNVSGFKYSKKNLSGQNSSSETDISVSCHLHYHICQRLSPGLLSKLQEGMYEPGRHILCGGRGYQNPLTTWGQGPPRTGTPAQNWFLQGYQEGSQREILLSHKPSKILQLFGNQSIGWAFQHERPTRAGPITLCERSAHKVISETHTRGHISTPPPPIVTFSMAFYGAI